MTYADALAAILATADERTLDRGERTEIRDVIAELAPTDAQLRSLRHALATHVEAVLQADEDKALFGWFLDVSRRLDPEPAEPTPRARAWFGPGDSMVETLEQYVTSARERLDLAVFTITDDRLTSQLIAAHRRGVRLRVLTDDDKADDRGNDARRLATAGVPVVFDASPHHFHHKFCVIDGSHLINGSYNWTRGAANDNRENFLVTWDRGLVHAYAEAFDRMWAELG